MLMYAQLLAILPMLVLSGILPMFPPPKKGERDRETERPRENI